MTEDLYGVLGISPDAEDIVVAAAYRALAQRYHPDKWRGSANEASVRMASINAAYAVLKDATKRAHYDRQRKSHSSYEPVSSNEKEDAFNAALEEVEDRWNLACMLYSDLQNIRARLARFSATLAFSFVVTILGTKKFDERVEFGEGLERQFLETHFGKSEVIVEFARALFLSGDRARAERLNKLLDVVGSGADPEVIISTIGWDHSLEEDWVAKRRELAHAAELKNLASAVRKNGAYFEAKLLAEKRGYQVEQVDRGFFKEHGVALLVDGKKKIEFKGWSEFCRWITAGL